MHGPKNPKPFTYHKHKDSGINKLRLKDGCRGTACVWGFGFGAFCLPKAWEV